MLSLFFIGHILLSLKYSGLVADQSFDENLPKAWKFGKPKSTEANITLYFFLSDCDGHVLRVRQSWGMLIEQNLDTFEHHGGQKHV